VAAGLVLVIIFEALQAFTCSTSYTVFVHSLFQRMDEPASIAGSLGPSYQRIITYLVWIVGMTGLASALPGKDILS